MTSQRAFTALCWAGLLVLAGAACGKTNNPSGGAGGIPGTGGEFPGTGGESQSKYRNGVACGFYTTASGSIWAAQNFQ
jgi:hypothetical protein